MTVRLGLLAILDQGPCYGYQLRTELDRRTGSRGPINVGQIYNTLDRLERDKLVRKTGAENRYEITATGSSDVAAWFGNASPPDELAGKIALASTLAGVDLRAIVAIQRAATESALAGASPSRVPESAEGVGLAIVRSALVQSGEAELRFLDEVENLIALGVPPLPLRSDVPKRGRPAKTAAD